MFRPRWQKGWPARTVLLTSLVLAALAVAGGLATGASAQERARELSGTVLADGKPAAGVTVSAFRAGASTPAATAQTGADGTYRLATLEPGVYRLEFSGAGIEGLVRPGVVVSPELPSELDVTVRRIADTNDVATPSEITSALQPGEVAVKLETPFGFIFIAVDTKRAPITSANFLKYVEGGFYNGGRFHRATRPDNYTPAPPDRPAMEIIQGGINPSRRDEAFPPIPLERTSVTGLRHVTGTVSMARGAGADTATSDFFILLDDQPSLDFGGKRFEDGQGGAAFGRVILGLSAVRYIQQQPVTGQNLTPPVPIVNASVVR